MEAAIMGYTAFGMSDFGVLSIDGHDEVQGGAQVFSDTLTRIRYDMANSESLDAYCEAAGRFQDFCAEELPVIALFGDVQIYARSEKFVGSVADGTFGLNNVKTWFSAIKEK